MKAIQIISIIYGIMNAANNGLFFLTSLLKSASPNSGSDYGGIFSEMAGFSDAFYSIFLVLGPFMVIIGISFVAGAKRIPTDFPKAKSILTAACWLSFLWFAGYIYKMGDVVDAIPDVGIASGSLSAMMYAAAVISGGVWYIGYPIFLLLFLRKKKEQQ